MSQPRKFKGLMSNTDREWIAWLIVVALCVVSGFTGVVFPPLPPTPSGIDAQGVAGQHTDLTGLQVSAPTDVPTGTPAVVADSAALGNILEIRDAATPIAYFEDGGGLTISTGFLNLPFADSTASTGSYAPTVAVVAFDSSGAATITMTACTVEGQILMMIGDDNNTITVADSNIRTTDGNAATLGQYDVLWWVCQDAEWLHIAKSANQ